MDVPFTVWQVGHGGWPFQGAYSTSGVVQPIVSNGVREVRALPTIPRPNGLTLVTWGVQIPNNVSTLDFQVGLADPSPPLPPKVNYSQVALSVKVNGETVWTKTIQTNGWEPAEVDISKWQGQNVVLELAADSLGLGVFEWAHWTGLTVQ